MASPAFRREPAAYSARSRLVPTTPLEVGITALRTAFQRQRGYQSVFKLVTHRLARGGVQIDWENAVTLERGVIVRLFAPAVETVVAELLAELQRLRGGKQICLPL